MIRDDSDIGIWLDRLLALMALALLAACTLFLCMALAAGLGWEVPLVDIPGIRVGQSGGD